MCEIALGSLLISHVLGIGAIVGLVLSLPAALLGLHKRLGLSTEDMSQFLSALCAVLALAYFVLASK